MQVLFPWKGRLCTLKRKGAAAAAGTFENVFLYCWWWQEWAVKRSIVWLINPNILNILHGEINQCEEKHQKTPETIDDFLFVCQSFSFKNSFFFFDSFGISICSMNFFSPTAQDPCLDVESTIPQLSVDNKVWCLLMTLRDSAEFRPTQCKEPKKLCLLWTQHNCSYGDRRGRDKKTR